MSGHRCPVCNSLDVEVDESNGTLECSACGTVLQENAVVSSVEFMESAGGSRCEAR